MNRAGTLCTERQLGQGRPTGGPEEDLQAHEGEWLAPADAFGADRTACADYLGHAGIPCIVNHPLKGRCAMKGRSIAAVALLVLVTACSTNSPTATEPQGPSREEAVANSGGMGSGHQSAR